MSNILLKRLEIENYGQFYDTASLTFDDRISAIVLDASKGKSTFVNALEYLSDAVLEGNIRNRWLNFCRTYVNKPKNFIRIEILLDIQDSTHSGVYRYGLSITDIGVLSEHLCKEGTGRRIFYRFKNEVDLHGLNDDPEKYVRSNLCVDKPILYLLKSYNSGISAYFIRFFQRLWVIRAGGLNYRLTPLHLFKNSFFTKRANVEKCCTFLRIFEPNIFDLMKVPNSSKIFVIHKNPDGYDYPVALSKESDTLIRALALFRALDSLAAYGGTVVWDAGEINNSVIDPDRFKLLVPDGVELIFTTTNDRLCNHMNVCKAKYVVF